MIKTNLFRLIIVSILTLMFISPLISQDKSISSILSEKLEIKRVVENFYIKGLRIRDFKLIREVCIVDAKLMGVNRDKNLQVTTLDQWSKKFDPKKPPLKKLFAEVGKIDLVGTAAQVTLNLIINDKQKVTDYLNMLKIQNKWKIVNIIDF